MQRNDLENKEYCINNDAIHEELNETEDQIDNEITEDTQNEDENAILIQSQQNEKKQKRTLGILCIMVSAFCFAIMTFLCKLAYHDNPSLNGFDYLLLRSSSMAPLSILQVIYLRVNVFKIQKSERLMLLIRCLAGGIGMPVFFIGLKYIPASIGSLIYNISPILVSVIAFIFLREKFTFLKLFAVVGAFIGVVVFIFGQHSTNKEYKKFYFGVICSAVYCIGATMIANKSIHYAISPFYFGITTYIEAILVLIFFPSLYNFDCYTFYGVSLMLASGVANYVGQTFRSIALKYEDASVVTPFNYFQVIYLLLSDVFVFNYTFSSIEIVGGVIISICLLGPEILQCILGCSKRNRLGYTSIS